MPIALSLYTLILLFFYIVIPGYLIRRFYFRGEFTKQLNTYKGHSANIVYSFVVGFIYSISILFSLKYLLGLNISISEFLNDFTDYFLRKDQDLSFKFKDATLNKHSIYLLSIYAFAILLGQIINWFVVNLSLDTKFKFLRFSNQWYYLFKGRILDYKNISKYNSKNLRVSYTFLDVLVDVNSVTEKLYSGLYADHSIKSGERNSLDKLYIYNPIRYSKKDGQTSMKEIPGNIFTIMGDRIIDINCRYVFEEVEEQKNRIQQRNNIIYAILKITASLFYFSIFIIVVFGINLFENTLLSIIIESVWYVKILFLFVLNIGLGLLVPIVRNKNGVIRFIGFKRFFLKVCLLASSTLLLFKIL